MILIGDERYFPFLGPTVNYQQLLLQQNLIVIIIPHGHKHPQNPPIKLHKLIIHLFPTHALLPLPPLLTATNKLPKTARTNVRLIPPTHLIIPLLLTTTRMSYDRRHMFLYFYVEGVEDALQDMLGGSGDQGYLAEVGGRIG